jgi:hypothetical protein
MEPFYLQHIPQSDYRRDKGDKEVNPDYVLDVGLKALNLKDNVLKKELVDKIKEAGTRIVKAVIPDDKHEMIISGRCLKEIYSKLGLS